MYSRLHIVFAFVMALAGLKAKLAWADKSKGAGGTDGGSGGTGGDDGGDDGAGGSDDKRTVSYDTYDKTMKELKALKRANKELADKQTSADNDRLQAEGKKDELINSLKSQVDKLTKGNKELVGSFASRSVNAQIREVAASMGCARPELIGRLIDLSDVEVDPKTFEADKGVITELLNGLKKSAPELFSKPAPKINSKMGNAGGGGEEKSNKDLSKQEIKDRLNQLHQQRQEQRR